MELVTSRPRSRSVVVDWGGCEKSPKSVAKKELCLRTIGFSES